MIICHSQKFIYVRSQKTASSSLQSFLSHACTENDVIYVKAGKLSKMTGLNEKISVLECDHAMDHAGLQTIEQNFPEEFKTYRLITSVRNPWDLEVSRFKYHTPDESQWSQASFSEWYTNRRAVANERYDQEKYVFHGDGTPIDAFVRVEHIDEDVPTLVKELSLEHLKGRAVPQLNSTSFVNYREFYSDELRKLVGEENKRIIELFGYSF